jgi:quinoprotein glucose dehydrogenase
LRLFDKAKGKRHKAKGRSVEPVKNIAISCAFCLVSATAILLGQADWPTYSHDDGSTRFSTLRQINTANVARLAMAWTYHMAPPSPAVPSAPASAGQGRAAATPAPAAAAQQGDAPAPAPAAQGRGGRGGVGGMRASEATPIVVKNVMYLPTPYGRVVALQADTGRELWSYQATGQPTQRGVEYWPGDAAAKPRILFSSGDRLVALDGVTGEPVSAFGTNGAVSLRDGVDNGFTTGQLSLSSPPHVYKNRVITGLRVQESPSFGYSGDTRGWDVYTGKLVYRAPLRR